MAIKGLDKTQDQLTIDLLTSCEEFDFYLTGSRFFNTFRENSDWDFFIQDAPDVRTFLSENDFKQMFDGGYEDQNFRCLWEKGKVQVQLVIDAKLKEQVQKILLNDKALSSIISNEFIRLDIRSKDICKKQARVFWNLAYDAFKAGMLYLEANLPINPTNVANPEERNVENFS